MDYYKISQSLALVDRGDAVTGKCDKWEAHKKGLLHRGFTVILLYKGQCLLQERKHPVFDRVYDLSFSSHPVYEGENLQEDADAIYEALKREWNLDRIDLAGKLLHEGAIYYKAEDEASGYTEHEVDHIYRAEIKRLPDPNPDFAYGYKLVKTDDVKRLTLNFNLAPWVTPVLEGNFI